MAGAQNPMPTPLSCTTSNGQRRDGISGAVNCGPLAGILPKGDWRLRGSRKNAGECAAIYAASQPDGRAGTRGGFELTPFQGQPLLGCGGEGISDNSGQGMGRF